MKITLTVGGQSRTLRVVRQRDRLGVTFEDGREVELRLLANGEGRFELERGHARIHGAGLVRGLERELWVDGRSLTYTCQMRRATREAIDEAGLASPLPAVVLEVLVEPGDTVRAGQKLILLESMKTVLAVQAPQDGTVHAVLCGRGDAVAAGVPLVQLD